MHVILLHDTNCNAHAIAWYQCTYGMHAYGTNACHTIWYGIRPMLHAIVRHASPMHASLWHGKNTCLIMEWYIPILLTIFILYEAIY